MAELSNKEKKLWKQWQDLCTRISQSEVAITIETEQEKQQRIKHLLKPENHEQFCDYYFPHYKTSKFGWFHKECNKAVLIDKNDFIVNEWSREFAKSVSVNVFLSIKLLVNGWLTGLILASETEDKAKRLIGDIQAELMHNKRLINDFGEFNILGSWLQANFYTGSGIGFWAFGIGQNPAGTRSGAKRPNLGIADDCDSKKKSKNENWANEQVDWLLGEFMGCLSTLDNIFIYNNNRVSKKGLTAHVVGDIEESYPKREGIKHIKAYFTENPKTREMLLPEQGGVPAWKERYTIEVCKRKIAKMGFRNAMRQLYHKDLPQGTRFKECNLPWAKPLPLDQYDALVTYCDPAFGESGKGCYRSIVFVGRTKNYYDILSVWLSQTGNFIEAHYRLHKEIREKSPVFIGQNAGLRLKMCDHWVESNDLQKILLKRLYQEANENREEAWFPRFDMDKKPDKIGRIEALEPLAENLHIRFNENMKTDKDMQVLREQFLSFPEGFIDGPDSVEGAIGKLRKKDVKKGFRPKTGSYTKKYR